MMSLDGVDVCERFAADLHDIDVVKCGQFKLKTGMVVPVYFDFRVIISHPKVLSRLGSEIAYRIEKVFGREAFDLICGVPYTALPFSVLAAQHLDKPMVMKRKEAKTYGTMTLIDGKFKKGDRCIIIEDTVTSGTSIVEVAQALEAAGLNVVGVVALLDREQGGASNLAMAGLNCSFLFKAGDLLRCLEKTGHLDKSTVDDVIEFLHSPTNRVGLSTEKCHSTEEKENATVSKVASCAAKLEDVSISGTNIPVSVGRRLYDIIKAKKSNLCLAADVETCKELIEVVNILGPYVCAIKTHVDSLKDEFDEETEKRLVELSKKHNFLIIEDRKLADIGNTSRRIFRRICKWADLVTVHALPGVDQVRAMSTALPDKSCGVLLIAQMSCEGNLVTPEYTKACLDMGRQFPGFVAGVIAQNVRAIGGQLQSFHCNNNFAIFTPGINLVSKGDAIGQRYTTPAEAIERGTDVVIVGRGILDAYDPNNPGAVQDICEKYRAASFDPYKACHAYELN